MIQAIIRAARAPRRLAFAQCRRCYATCADLRHIGDPMPERWSCECGAVSFDVACVARWRADVLENG